MCALLFIERGGEVWMNVDSLCDFDWEFTVIWMTKSTRKVINL